MGGSIGSGMNFCENSGVPIGMVLRFHRRNVYTKRKLQVWKTQKCIALVGAESLLNSAGPKTTPFHGGQYRV